MTQPYVAPEGWTPPPAKPPLAPRQKNGARIAGAVGFLLLSLGFGLFAIPLALLAFGAFFAIIFGAIQRGSRDADLNGFTEFIENLNVGAWILPLALAAVLGLAIMAVALFVSARILRSHDVYRPWPVTWAGAGIAIVANWFVAGLVSVPLQFVGAFRGDSGESWPVGLIVGVVSFLVSIAATAVVGALSWWWMAHAMRSPTAIARP